MRNALRPLCAAAGVAEARSALITRIFRFEDMEDDWDSYGGFAISPAAMLAAIRRVCELPANVVGDVIAVPTSDGSVWLELHAYGLAWTQEFDSEGASEQRPRLLEDMLADLEGEGSST